MEKINQVVAAVEDAGFDCAIAIATNAEVQSGAACGQMSLVTAAMEQNTIS